LVPTEVERAIMVSAYGVFSSPARRLPELFNSEVSDRSIAF
jgi:hypothetical protein